MKKYILTSYNSDRVFQPPQLFDSHVLAFEEMERQYNAARNNAESWENPGTESICANRAYCLNEDYERMTWQIFEANVPDVPAKVEHHIFGEYVLTPIPNAFNEKTGWWLSKRDTLDAVYCFSTSGSEAAQAKEAAYHTANIDGYIGMFKERLCRLFARQDGDSQ